jgi:hypothetical protein
LAANNPSPPANKIETRRQAGFDFVADWDENLGFDK